MPVQLPVEQQPSLASATNGLSARSLLDAIPLPLVLLLASPYLSGQTQEEAIKTAHKIYREDRFSGTVDVLGEDSETSEECERAVEFYKNLIAAVSQSKIPCSNRLEQLSVSMKPSMFSEGAPVAGDTAKLDRAYARIKSVVDYARQNQVSITLEAEDNKWADFQLDAYTALIKEGYTNCGTVLQSRLFRTRNDIKRFDDRMRVRMVIGIYNEPADIAHTEKQVMKDLMVEFASELAKRGTYVEMATHDAHYIDKFIHQVAIPQRLPASRFETQFLVG